MQRSRGLGSGSRREAGFSLFTVLMVLVLIALSASILVEHVGLDTRVLAVERNQRLAAEFAEAGVLEVSADEDIDRLVTNLLSDPVTTYNGSSLSPLQGGATAGLVERTRETTLSLLRVAPIRESQYDIVRGLIFEVRNTATVNDDAAERSVAAQSVRIVSMPTGTVLSVPYAR